MNESNTTDGEDYWEMTAWEQRREICRRLGVNERLTTPLSKRSLNSLYAYLTGEFLVDPDSLFGEDAHTLPEMMDEVSVVVGLTEWAGHYTDVYYGYRDQHRPFRNDERARILEAMDESGDRREWVDGGAGELDG